jgi:AAA domain-containing protein
MDDKPRGPLGAADWAAFLANQKAAGDSPPQPNGADDYGNLGAPPPIGDEPAKPNFRSLKTFCAEFRPISYAVAGLMREASLYTITGRTGEGKTSFLVPLALALATGRGELIGRKVKKGPVAFCTAENPDDLRMRLMIACFIFNIDLDVLDRDIMISDNRVTPEAISEWIKASEIDFTLIIVDTWQAYFDGKDANNPTQAVEFTRRFRPLANLTGAPVVLIAAHPNKGAADDRLVPNGAGSVLNEVDGNFTMLRDETGLYCLHWLGKIRGVPFEPLHFKIDRFDSPDVVTIEGVRVQMPVMSSIGEGEVEAREDRLAGRDMTLLEAMKANPAGSERTWATVAGITRRVAQTTLDRLKRDRLVSKKARRWSLTKEGEKWLT